MTTVDKSRFRATPVLRPRRRKLMARVRLVNGTGLAQDVVVENVSAQGVQVILSGTAPELGEMVSLELPESQTLWGVVRWIDGIRFGIEMDTTATPPDQPGTGDQSICLRPTRR